MTDDDLNYFFSGYFHEDWMDEAARWNRTERSTWQGVVAQFVGQEPSSSVPVGALAELSVVIESPLVDGERIYDEFDLCYWGFDDQSVGEWLVELRGEIADQLLANGKVDDNVFPELLDELDSLGLAAPQPHGVDRNVGVAEAFGASEPLRAVFDVLNDLSIALAPSSPVDDGTRWWLESVRTAIAQSVVSRWSRTARHLL